MSAGPPVPTRHPPQARRDISGRGTDRYRIVCVSEDRMSSSGLLLFGEENCTMRHPFAQKSFIAAGLHWIIHQTPFVTGKAATASGESKWITGRKLANGMMDDP